MKVLVVDDNAVNRKLLRVILTSAGHEIAEAADGLEALERLRDGRFDAVITDVLMPRLDGYRLCYEMRKTAEFKDLPVIIYTSTYTSPADEELARNVGADRFLRKPAPAAVVLGSLSEVTSSPRAAANTGRAAEDLSVLREYSEALVRKLEQKNAELEAAQAGLKSTIDALEKSESRVRDLIETAPIGIYQSTPGGSFLEANAALANILGYDSPNELLSFDLARDVYFDPSGRTEAVRRFLAGEHSLDLQWKRKNGTPVWVETDGRIVRDSTGAPVRFEGFVRDISVRKLAEERADQKSRDSIQRRRKRLLRDVAAMIGIGLVTFILASRFEWFRGAADWVMRHDSDPVGVDDLIVTMTVLAAVGVAFSYRRWKELSSEVRERERTEQALRFLRRDLENRVNERTSELRKINQELSNEVDERRRAETSAKTLDQAVEQSSNVVFMTDRDGNIDYVNSAFDVVYGYSKEEILGQNPRILKSGVHQSADYKHFWDAVLSGEGFQGEMINRAKDGRLVTVEANVNSVNDRQGQRIGFIAVQNDITKRKAAEKALEESEEHFRSLIENASDIIAVIEENGNVRYASPSTERVLGFKSEELQGREFMSFIHPDDQPVAEARLARTLKYPERPEQGEYRCRHRDGRWRTLQTRATVLETGTGPRAVVLNARDITEQRESEEARAGSEKRLRHVVTSSPAVTYSLDPGDAESGSMPVTWISENVVQLLGYSQEESLSPGWWPEHLHPDEREAIFAGVARVFQQGHSVAEYQFRKSDGSYRWMRDEQRLFRDDDGKPTEIIGTWSDVSERKTLEDQYRHAQKMEAVGRLAGGIAHDFNNLLMVIGGMGELLELNLDNQEKMRGYAEELRKATARGAALTQQLLAFSRKQVVKPVAFDPGEVLREMETMLGRLLGEDIDLACSLAPGSTHVLMDRGQFDQVIMNLAINARDAMPSGGRLSIGLETVVRDESYAATHAEARPGPFVRITMEDSGTGMDASVQRHIFEPFFTTKESGKGTGLGLATVYGIVKGAGGDIWVYSEPGHGTTFKIYLPPADEASAVETTAPSTIEIPVRAADTTILLLEDEETIRAMVEEYLTEIGYKIISARDGNESLLLADGEASRIDLLITDVVVPGKNGREVADALRRTNPSLRVIFMSGYTDDAAIVKGVRSEGVEFLQKPFRMNSLAQKIREVLSRRNGD